KPGIERHHAWQAGGRYGVVGRPARPSGRSAQLPECVDRAPDIAESVDLDASHLRNGSRVVEGPDGQVRTARRGHLEELAGEVERRHGGTGLRRRLEAEVEVLRHRLVGAVHLDAALDRDAVERGWLQSVRDEREAATVPFEASRGLGL